jgi:hypothetical protein
MDIVERTQQSVEKRGDEQVVLGPAQVVGREVLAFRYL